MRAQHLRGDALDTALHLGRRAAREGQQQDAPRIDAADDEMRDPMRQGVGLAGAGAGDDQQRWRVVERVAAVLDRAPLRVVQLGEVVCSRRRGFRPIRDKLKFLQALSPLPNTASLSYKA